ncbi:MULTISPECIES: DUF6769 family protein [Bacteroides]|uniref:DUF6769 family protein n=1 Tax=Bacteroides TaxID=816 RepID=UPI0005A7D3DC|nr:DUF6769 family protein [Bacteroides neonati]
MKKKTNIALVVISVLIVLVAPFIPHHHHEGVACAMIERCSEDNAYNDEHTTHNESSADSGMLCVENAQYLTSKTKQSNSVCRDNIHPNLLFSVLISQFSLLLNADLDVSGQYMYGEQVIIYKSAEIISSNGLRAPPYILA